MSEKPLFTREQLPVGVVMMVVKLESGEELASVLNKDAPLEAITEVFRVLATVTKLEA